MRNELNEEVRRSQTIAP